MFIFKVVASVIRSSYYELIWTIVKFTVYAYEANSRFGILNDKLLENIYFIELLEVEATVMYLYWK